MLRVLVAGDIRIYRDGVVAHLRTLSRFTVVGAAASPDETLALCQESEPDVVVLDMAMPASLDVVRALMRLLPDVKIVALTVPDVERAVVVCAEAGIAGYVSRAGSLDDVASAVDRAACGEIAISSSAAAGLYRRVSALAAALGGAGASAVPGGQCVELTPREREIMSLVERGLSNKQIGAQLSIELATVKNHVHNILEKLHVRRRSDAVASVQRPAALFPFVFDTTQRMTESQPDAGRMRI